MSRGVVIIFSLLLGGQLFLILSFIHYQEYFKNRTISIVQEERRMNPEEMKNVTQFTGNNGEQAQVLTWNLSREIMLSEGAASPSIPKPHQHFLLLIRKLVLFSVREVNRRVSGEGCVYWWVNPLSVQTLEKRSVYPGVLTYGLTFQIQPGNIPFQANVLAVEHGGDRVSPGTHLEYLGGTRLDPLPQDCGTVEKTVRNVCLCPGEVGEAEEVTAKLRMEWAKTDPELFSWPPNVPMFASDYIALGDSRLYVKTPSNKTEYCDPMVKMIIFISSAPSHTLQRKTIRKTFGNPDYLHPMGVRLLFLFGRITNQVLQKKIDKEFNKHEDTVQADFADSYHNLSLVHLSMYNWVVTRCNGDKVMPKWVLKSDDDYFLNPQLALRVADKNPDIEFLGHLFCGSPAVRNVASMKKYYIPRYLYAPGIYPGYLSSTAYLVQTDTFHRILAASINIPLIHTDDCYVMGLLTKEVGILPRNNKLFTTRLVKPDGCKTKLMVNSWTTNLTDMELYWNSFIQPVPESQQCHLNQRRLKAVPLNRAKYTKCAYE